MRALLWNSIIKLMSLVMALDHGSDLSTNCKINNNKINNQMSSSETQGVK